ATSLVAAGRTMTVNGAFQIDQGASPGTAGTWSYNASGKLVFNNTSSLTVNGTDIYWPSASGPPNVTVQNGGGVTLAAGVSRRISGTLAVGAGGGKLRTNANTLTSGAGVSGTGAASAMYL